MELEEETAENAERAETISFLGISQRTLVLCGFFCTGNELGLVETVNFRTVVGYDWPVTVGVSVAW